jgi:pilus assembly protein CpaF
MTLLTIHQPGQAPNKTELPDGDYTIGRSERCRIRLPHAAVSEKHALLVLRADGCWVEDLGSSNGTYLNAVPIRGRQAIVPSAPVTIGPFTLMLAPVPLDEIATPPSEPTPAPQAAPPPKVAVVESLRTDPLSEQRRSIKAQIHRELVERLDIKRLSTARVDSEELHRRAREAIDAIVREVRGRLPPGMDPAELAREIHNEALKLGPLEDFLEDETISEIMVNGPDRIFVERGGRIELSGKTFMDEQSVMAIIERIVAPLGRRVDESQPYVDARLPDGSRVNAIIHPLSLVGPCLTIRKFSKKPLVDADLIRFGTFTPDMARFMQICVLMRKNIVVSGGTGSGKTTLLNVLSNYLPPDERIVTIEDAAELRLNQPHLVRLEARPPNIEGRGAITIRDLVRNSLRMRPDRIIVGECRGGEALDMLQAMNTGHDGSLTTVHANAPRDVISRLETMVLMSGMDLPSRAIREQISSAIDVIIHESRLSDGSRKVTCISEVVGLEGNQITMQDLFEFRQTGVTAGGKVAGHFRPTGSMPTFYDELSARGIEVDPTIFHPHREGGASG